jgi:chromosome segregation ATPase
MIENGRSPTLCVAQTDHAGHRIDKRPRSTFPMTARTRVAPDPPSQAEAGDIPGSDESIQEMIMSRREILDDLMQSIDDSQETADMLRAQITDMEIKVAHAKHEIGQLRAIQDRQTVQAIHPVSCPNFDVKTLNVEQRDFVNDIVDRILQLEQELQRQGQANSDLEDEYNALVHANEDLKKGIRQTTLRIKKQNQKERYLKDRIAQTQKRLQDQELQIRSNSQTLNITATAVSGLIERRQELDQRAGGLLELKNRLQQVREGITREESDLESLKSQMRDLKQATDSAITDVRHEIEQIQEVANWSEESRRILTEIEKGQAELKQTRSQNADANTRYNLMHNRFRQLVPLFKKWGNSDLSPFQPNETLDSLLVQCTKAVTKTSADLSGATKSLEDKMAQNSQTESLARKRAEELERAIRLFRIEAARLKEQIESKRAGWAEEEHELVAQISKLKVRLAQRQLKQ